METFVYKDHKKLRCGYTTGTCAALAAQGAVRFLLTGSWRETEELMTPKGIPVRVALEEKLPGMAGRSAQSGRTPGMTMM